MDNKSKDMTYEDMVCEAFKKGDVVVTRCGKIYQLDDDPVNHPTWGACANVRKYRTNIVHGIRLRDVHHHPFYFKDLTRRHQKLSWLRD